MLISRGDAIVAIAMSVEAGQYVISIPQQIASSVMDAIKDLHPTHYLDKGAEEIMVVEGDHAATALGAMATYQSIFGENTISSVAVLPVGTTPREVAGALAAGSRGGIHEDPPTLILLSPGNEDPEVNYVTDLLMQALKAGSPSSYAYLMEGARAYEEKYGED